ncbi:MAG: hypothetical protein AVDCRST_MAG49-1488 [uncultured Thermomicrobiales bacterium]|uniref:Uncharacterized protein n=1 Tax=uncultured Thermomicrobiales bacterium TaxID=1645740 RepID=A0A6J4UDR0_9BACT|nr:MAG: hypothetical protein AVDCRST_MAG49-1488 [uncultured Thermomicrobiales bacterium]
MEYSLWSCRERDGGRDRPGKSDRGGATRLAPATDGVADGPV